MAVDAAQLAPHRRIDLGDVRRRLRRLLGPQALRPVRRRCARRPAPTGSTRARPTCAAAAPRGGSPRAGPTWATGPARHEGGSPNVIGAIALAAACAAVSAHRDAIEGHEARLLSRLRVGLDAIPRVDTWSIFGDDHDRVAVLPFTIERFDSSLVSAILSAEHGIGVRDGKFCAHILVDELLEDPWGDVPATAVRVSLGLATTLEHVDRLVEAVAELAAHGPSRPYTRTDQGWVAEGDDRDVSLPRPW